MKRWMKRTLVIVAVIVVLSIVALAVIPLFVLPHYVGQRVEQSISDPAYFGVEAEEIPLTTDDGLTLASWLVKADDPQAAQGTVIIVSGLHGPSVTAYFGFAKMFAEHGYNSLLVEMRARGLSEGEEIGFGMTEWRDVKAAADYLEDTDLPVIAMGTSMGAATVIVAAAEVESIDAVIAASPPSSVEDMMTSLMEIYGIPRWIGRLEGPFLDLHLGLHYGFDALQYMSGKAVGRLGDRPLLLMQSTGDVQVRLWEHEKLLRLARENGVEVQTFIREGYWHYICYDDDFLTPWEDTEFADALLGFLDTLP